MSSQTSQGSGSKSDDEAALRAMYQQMMDGWNKGNGEAFATPYCEDSDLVGFDGTHLKGRQEIASFHQQLFNKFLKGSHLVGKIRSIRFLTPNVAVIHAVGGTVMAGQSDIDPDRNSVHTLVAMKRGGDGGKWCLAAFQNTRAHYIGRPEESQILTEELQQEL